jgi:hypothetical protein
MKTTTDNLRIMGTSFDPIEIDPVHQLNNAVAGLYTVGSQVKVPLKMTASQTCRAP